MEQVYDLRRDLPPGVLVRWATLGGTEHTGRLKEWDNGTAIVVTEDGKELAVRSE